MTKTEIIIRLQQDGHITGEEAVFLAQNEVPQYITTIPSSPYYTVTAASTPVSDTCGQWMSIDGQMFWITNAPATCYRTA